MNMAEEHPLVRLARQAVEAYVREGRIIEPPEELPEEMRQRSGAFVSLHKGSELRGCIGTIEPVRRNLAEEVIANAVSAASRDPRFPPVRSDELEDLDISVDVLSEPEPVKSIAELDPRVYGVVVQSGYRRGVLLPDLEGVDTVEKQLAIALQKAWIDPREPYQIYRFRVNRYH